MQESPKVLAIVPARAGSKGIAQKNIADVAGKPLLAWTIEAARRSKKLDRLILSTDCSKIAKIGERYGAEVPFLRPERFATDESDSVQFCLDLLDRLKAGEHYLPTHVLLLQPTSPLRETADIDHAIRLCLEKKASCVVSVCESSASPHWMKTICADGYLHPFLSDAKSSFRRQELPKVYQVNGAIYLLRTEILFQRLSWYAERVLALPMPKERSIDIDCAWDLDLARWALQRKNAKQALPQQIPVASS